MLLATGVVAIMLVFVTGIVVAGRAGAVSGLELPSTTTTNTVSQANSRGDGGEPFRVLLIGDSILDQSADAIRSALWAAGASDEISFVTVAIPNTGLLTPELFDWQAEMDRLVDGYDPDLVVALFVGNYKTENLLRDDTGNEIHAHTPAFWDAWREATHDAMRRLTAGGAAVRWVTPPPMFADELDRSSRELARVYREVAAAWARTEVVDGRSPLADEHGNWLEWVTGPDNTPIPLRVADSVHLSEEGGKRLGTAIAKAILAARP